MSESPKIIRIKDADNVAVAVHDLPAGVEVMPGLCTRDPIPQAHKIALQDIPAGGEIIRYGVVLGYATADIPAGSWINEHMLNLPESPSLKDLSYATNLVPVDQLPAPTRTTWMGYRNKTGPAGTRNLLGIVTTVQCAAGVLKVAVERIRRELLPKYPNVDGVVAVTHPYGCGVAINAPLANIPIRAVTNLIRHPNFGGEIMVVGLGCEKLTYDRVLPPEDITPENVLTLQDYAGHDAMMQAILDMADKKLQRLNQRRREELPLSELLIGMQCGGSDAFSGITANPSAGYAADMLVRGGATVLFSEVTEVRTACPCWPPAVWTSTPGTAWPKRCSGTTTIWPQAGWTGTPTPPRATRRAVLPTLWKRPWAPLPSRAPAPSWRCSPLPSSPPNTA